ncbi:MAG: GDSL-type esterase/lipase family protein [Cyclobacteriaceae bacterium]
MNRTILIINLILTMPSLIQARQPFSINEYANFAKYASANDSLKQADALPKVVFMGNSITEGWVNMRPAFFTDNSFLGRGIGGQVSHQMLLRFQADVIDLNPEVVVILAGTNDIAQNSGPVTLDQIMNNITAMATLARGNGIKVALCSVLPAIAFPWFPDISPAPLIVKLNEQIQQYAQSNDLIYVDYYSAMVDDEGGLRVPEHTSSDDLVHPNPTGYKVMEEILLKSLKPLLE